MAERVYHPQAYAHIDEFKQGYIFRTGEMGMVNTKRNRILKEITLKKIDEGCGYGLGG